MGKSSQTYKIEVGRDSRTGQFIKPEDARRNPNTTEVEHIRIPRDKDK